MDRNKEDLGFEERRVAELIGTLKSVDAPGDFDMRVRSRIAINREATVSPSWRPLVAGLAAAVVIGGGYLGYRSTQPAPVSITAESKSPANPAPIISGPAIEPAPRVTAESPAQTAETVASQKPPSGPKTPKPPSTGGSIDQALKDTQKFEPSGAGRAVGGSSDVRSMGTGEISVNSVFSILGVDATWEGSGWRVSSVRSHSVADRASLKAGDVVEAIDGRPLTATSRFVGRFDGKSLRVRRDGATLDLALRP